MSHKAPYSDKKIKGLLQNLATRISWLISNEIEYDIEEVIASFFLSSIYSEEEKEEMEKSIDSIFFSSSSFMFPDSIISAIFSNLATCSSKRSVA